jgi:hypothetical protein
LERFENVGVEAAVIWSVESSIMVSVKELRCIDAVGVKVEVVVVLEGNKLG